MTGKTNIRNLSLEALTEAIIDLGFPKFRAKQVYHWLWKKVRRDFSEMINLPKALVGALEENYFIDTITEDTLQHSNDGTIKARYRLWDGHLIESVLIPVPSDNRYTVCVSSQVGCSLSCKFCATGKMGFLRQLTPGEIFEQVFVSISFVSRLLVDH